MISIIIPAYNAAAVIKQCLDSVRVQSYNECEAIIVNDCSTDNTQEIVEQYIQNHPQHRIILHNQPANKGVSCARNSGLQIANGEYVFFLDADDTIYPKALESLSEAMSPDCDMVVGGHDVTCTGQTKHSSLQYEQCSEYSNKEVFKAFAEGEWHVMPWNKLIRKSFLLSNNLFFNEDMRFHEDYVWNIFLATKAKCVKTIDKQTYNYIVNEDSITSNLNIEKDLRGYILAFIRIADYYKANNLCNSTDAYLLLEGKKSGVMYSLLQKGENKLFNKYYNEFKDSVIVSPYKAWRKKIIPFGYFIRDVHYTMPFWLGKTYKLLFYSLFYKLRGKKVQGAIWK